MNTVVRVSYMTYASIHHKKKFRRSRLLPCLTALTLAWGAHAAGRASLPAAETPVAQIFRTASVAALGPAQTIGDGVELFEPKDPALLGLPEPSAVQLLRVDPSRASVRVALAHDRTSGAEPVAGITARHQAMAATNAGFFNVKTGQPVGVVKVGGELVSDAPLPRGAVAVPWGPDGVRGVRSRANAPDAALHVERRTHRLPDRRRQHAAAPRAADALHAAVGSHDRYRRERHRVDRFRIARQDRRASPRRRQPHSGKRRGAVVRRRHRRP